MATRKLSLGSWSFFTFSILLALFSSISATASPYSNHNDDNVRKRALAFGTLSEFSPNRHPLVKRVTKVTYASGQTRGQKLVLAMACSQDPSQYLAYSALQANGWNEDAGASITLPPADLVDALNGNSLSTSAADYNYVRMVQNAEFPYQGSYNGICQDPTQAYFVEAMNPKQGVFIALESFGPYSFVAGSPLYPIDPVPQLYRWSDIAYLVWANACSTANVNPDTIQYFFRYHINNDSGTQDIINQAAGVTSAAGLKPWPGMKFDTTTPQGEALLGSAHGFGVAWFLQQHQATLGKKTVDYITVFQTTDASVGTQYNMMIHVADVS